VNGPVPLAADPTVLDQIVAALREEARFNEETHVAPAAILWPDREPPSPCPCPLWRTGWPG
jgi:hypothetical protein